jgi:uncharacterized protein
MSRTLSPTQPTRPWYKEPWPWLLMFFPLTAVLAGVATVVIAFRSDDGLVAKDYYKKGLTINRVLAKQERAAQLGLSAQVQQSGNRIVLQLESSRELTPAKQLKLTLLNPSRAGFDQAIMLQLDVDHYSGEIASVRDGRWNLKLEDEGGVWQLSAETTLPLKEPVRLKP